MSAKEKKKSNALPAGFLFVLVLVLLGVFLGFLAYLRSKHFLFLFISPLLFLAIGLAFAPFYKEEDRRRKALTKGEVYVRFFENFRLYSTMKSSYHEGLLLAVESLPISLFKDRMEDYLEAHDATLLLPIDYTNTREEKLLSDEIKKLLCSEEEFSLPAFDFYQECLLRYKEEALAKKEESIFPLLETLLYVFFTAVLLTGVISAYAS